MSLPDARTLADHLALERTVLANERTLLAYARTALGLLGAGAAAAHFIDDPWLVVMGWALALASPVVMGAGVVRYRRVRAHLAEVGASFTGR